MLCSKLNYQKFKVEILFEEQRNTLEEQLKATFFVPSLLLSSLESTDENVYEP